MPELVSRAVHRDEEAFAALYERYRPLMMHFAWRQLGNAQDAEDATSMVFLNAWRRIEHYTADGTPFRVWLYMIARNSCIDILRSRTRNSHIEARLISFMPRAPVESSSALAEVAVRDLLSVLPPKQHEVLWCKFVNDQEGPAIARATGQKPDAVRALSMRGIHKLRRHLDVHPDAA